MQALRPVSKRRYRFSGSGSDNQYTRGEELNQIHRRALLAILLLGILGSAAELLLLEHTDGWWQLTPLLLMGVSLLVLVWHWLDRGRAPLRGVQFIMILFVLSGFAGTLLHYKGNAEFELEREPTLSGWALFRDTMTGATPALAPGTMMLLGLIGLLYTFGHPALSDGNVPQASSLDDSP